MAYILDRNGEEVNCYFTDIELCIKGDDSVIDKIEINDLIGVTTNSEQDDDESDSINIQIHSIEKSNTKIWRKTTQQLSGVREICESFLELIKGKLQTLPRAKRLLVLISLVAGSQNGESIFYQSVQPLLELAGISWKVKLSEYPDHIKDLVLGYDIKEIDGILVLGGDGSFGQCVNGLFERTQKTGNTDYHDPGAPLVPLTLPVASIPTGTKNVVAGYCYGCMDVETSILHVIRGMKRQLEIANVYINNRWVGSSCVAAMYGTLSNLMQYTEGYRWLKTLRYLIVPAIYFLFETTPLFEAKIMLRKRDGSVETIEGSFHDLIALNHETMMPNLYIGSDQWTEGFLTVKLYNPTGNFQLWKNFMNKIIRGSNYVAPDFIEKHEATSVVLDIKKFRGSVDVKQKSCVLVDGEYIEEEFSKIEIRYQVCGNANT